MIAAWFEEVKIEVFQEAHTWESFTQSGSSLENSYLRWTFFLHMEDWGNKIDSFPWK